jgi:hypothetical protein
MSLHSSEVRSNLTIRRRIRVKKLKVKELPGVSESPEVNLVRQLMEGCGP